jgi:hypothetical protein
MTQTAAATTTEIPDWVDNTPNLYYELDMGDDRLGDIQQIILEREEFEHLKECLAIRRGFLEPSATTDVSEEHGDVDLEVKSPKHPVVGLGTEKLREAACDSLQGYLTDFLNHGSLAELLFLQETFQMAESNRGGSTNAECVLADSALWVLGMGPAFADQRR